MTPAGRAAAAAGVVLGLASAAVSAWWTAGGTALLDTVGGAVEDLARERTPAALAAGAATVLAKLVAAALATVPALHRRRLRALGRLAGALLVLWGGANVLLGGLVLTGVLDLGPVADERALRWHVLVWDLWFLLWGTALLAACRSAARAQRSGAVEPRSSSTGSTSSP